MHAKLLWFVAVVARAFVTAHVNPPGGGSAGPPPNGGNGVIRGTTRRRHAANQLLMLQNPHRSQPRAPRRLQDLGRADWRDNVATLKPTTPLLAPNKGPVKPASPLHPENAPKTPISHPQRRWRFQPHAQTSEQRRQGFHARDFRCPRAAAGPGRAPSQRAEPHISDQAPLVWRAPEGPEIVRGPGCGAHVGGGGATPPKSRT